MQTTATATDLVQRDERAVANALKIRYTPFVMERGEGGRVFDAEGRSVHLDFAAYWCLFPGSATAMTAFARLSSPNWNAPPLPGSSPASTSRRSSWPSA